MADQMKEFADVPKEFFHEGSMFLRRCQKPSKTEFFKISQAVGIGFIVMGAIGFVIKLIHIPVNNVLVS